MHDAASRFERISNLLRDPNLIAAPSASGGCNAFACTVREWGAQASTIDIRPLPLTLALETIGSAVIGGNVPGIWHQIGNELLQSLALRQKIGAAAREAVLEAENLNELMDAD